MRYTHCSLALDSVTPVIITLPFVFLDIDTAKLRYWLPACALNCDFSSFFFFFFFASKCLASALQVSH